MASNARIQRLQLLLRLGLAAGLLAWLTASGPRLGVLPALAWAALLFWGAVGLVMLVSFAALRHLNRASPPPARRPGLAELARAFWQELLTYERVFSWQQPFCEQQQADHLPTVPAAGQRGVLLLHGYSCNRGLWNPWMQRLRQRDQAFMALTLEPAFGSIDAYADQIEAARQRLERATGRAPVVLAHSMGGLALRAWWRRHGTPAGLHRAYTLGTPHAGTFWARWGFTANARQMRQSGAWLSELAAGDEAGLRERLVCYYSNADQVVCPAQTAVLPGAEARYRPGLGHLRLVQDAALMQELLAELAEPGPTPTAAPLQAGTAPG